MLRRQGALRGVMAAARCLELEAGGGRARPFESPPTPPGACMATALSEFYRTPLWAVPGLGPPGDAGLWALPWQDQRKVLRVQNPGLVARSEGHELAPDMSYNEAVVYDNEENAENAERPGRSRDQAMDAKPRPWEQSRAQVTEAEQAGLVIINAVRPFVHSCRGRAPLSWPLLAPFNRSTLPPAPFRPDYTGCRSSALRPAAAARAPRLREQGRAAGDGQIQRHLCGPGRHRVPAPRRGGLRRRDPGQRR
jgi:hypothetical protein